jgi:hypothetical protein
VADCFEHEFSGLGIGFIAVYMARVYKDGMNKPRYIIDWKNTKLHFLKNKSGFSSSEATQTK